MLVHYSCHIHIQLYIYVYSTHANALHCNVADIVALCNLNTPSNNRDWLMLYRHCGELHGCGQLLDTHEDVKLIGIPHPKAKGKTKNQNCPSK